MNILITGGTGSLGQFLAKEYHRRNEVPDKLILLSRDSQKQKTMAESFDWGPQVRFIAKDIQHYWDLLEVFYGVDIIIHAAAFKLVDAALYNPEETIHVNVGGTETVLRAARHAGVQKVLLISSDKAVEPTNIYGVTKCAAETLAVSSNVYSYGRGCISAAVRYGNVLGSRGSVTWIWKRQLANDLPIHITDLSMTRFIITFTKAYDLIQYALENMKGGEIFVPRLPSISLDDLKTAMDISDKKISLIGLRPGGEKFHEVLWNHEEEGRMVETGGMMQDYLKIFPSASPWSDTPPLPIPDYTLMQGRSSLDAEKITVSEMREILKIHHPLVEP